MAVERPEPRGDECDRDDDQLDPNFPAPAKATTIRRERRDEPVEPERSPPDREDELDGAHSRDNAGVDEPGATHEAKEDEEYARFETLARKLVNTPKPTPSAEDLP